MFRKRDRRQRSYAIFNGEQRQQIALFLNFNPVFEYPDVGGEKFILQFE